MIASRPAALNRQQDAKPGEAAGRQCRHGEAGQEQPGIDAAEELHQAQHRQSGHHEQPQVTESGQQLAEDDLAAMQIGGQQEFEGSPFLFLGHGAGNISRREQHNDGKLHRREGVKETLGQHGLLLVRLLHSLDVLLMLKAPNPMDPEQQ